MSHVDTTGDLTPNPRAEARVWVRIARDIREERQAVGDTRDNGDASCLATAAEYRRRATS